MRAHLFALSLAAMTLAACSGGSGGSSPTPVTPSTSNPQSGARTTNEDAVADTNGVGTPVKDFTSYDESTIGSVSSSANSRVIQSASGTCHLGAEFFSPDTSGDANSTETKLFYDSACTVIARDVVRVFSSTSASSETVARSAMLYAYQNTTPVATRTSSETLSNATFDSYGFPELAAGFDRTGSSALVIDGTHTTMAASELVMGAQSSGVSPFCNDSAGFSANGSSTLDESYGWSGGVLANGSRTVNADGSVTWSAIHAGTAYKGAVGSLAIATGTQNTACPISTPAVTLTGGTVIGGYTIPVIVTDRGGMLVSFSITGATLPNGDSLSVSTTSGALPSSANFIVGVISRGSTQIATFAIDAFGDGTLTVTQTGAQFVITDWHVVK